MNRDCSVRQIQNLVTEALSQIDNAKTSSDLETIRIRFLGKKGSITDQLKKIGTLSNEDRRLFGQAVNTGKETVVQRLIGRVAEFDTLQQNAALATGWLDISLRGRNIGTGCAHPVSRTIRRITDIFERLGFDVAEGPEIEDDYHNFEALNIPENHPARAMHDTFYVKPKGVLRTHTSPVQIRYLATRQPPITVIAPGRVFRCDSDLTHTPMFHQVEGLVVDKDISFADLKGALIFFVREYFEEDLPVRFRPSYFPFTEPSAEVDIGCVFCSSKGCRVCQKTGWLEILGCGMVHPTVFDKVGIDNDKYTGYAFGVGIERLTMLRYGVDDLRLFFENELSFLNQFR
ncbi:MAG: phenylalanine--tRNA ligase subunit alpha [Acidiferrobacteraceae bacterium]|nr:phenylalanine--tRNA ligase subunit alpha [Acidiferrobacteraceae bacterium]